MSNVSNDFAVFILSNGRANNVITYETLKKHGYTGKIYIIIDDEDKQISEYKKKYGENIIVFCKQDAINITDSMDNFKKKNAVVYARNYSFVIAEKLKVKYFLVLDDDYSQFCFSVNSKKEYFRENSKIKNLDKVIDKMLNYFKDNENIKSIAMSQGGDYIGGSNCGIFKKFEKGEIPRKVMNSFFCCTERPFKFFGSINEDVNAYVYLGSTGVLFFTIVPIRLEQKQTQLNKGGLTDIYLDLGTYVKSFYSVMIMPSAVKLMSMGVKDKRIHHKVNWNNAIPCILEEKYKKN